MFGFIKCLPIISFLLLQAIQFGVGQNFGYDGRDGPDHWKEQYKECYGKHQSPINIDMNKVIYTKYPKLIFENIDLEHKAKIVNNGHTVMMTFEGENMPTISGGPLKNIYKFVQLHFHWGDNDTFGSENQINNLTFPMELHVVFHNKKYNEINDAMKHPDGLTVLSFLYEISDTDNIDYVDFVQALNHIHEVNSSTPIAHKESLLELIRPVVDSDLKEYFTYEGSLTTPPCSEVVVWIEFRTPISLSHAQIEEFRQLSDHFGRMKHNFRPVQPINDRLVYFNDINSIDKDGVTSISQTMSFILAILSLFIVTNQLIF